MSGLFQQSTPQVQGPLDVVQAQKNIQARLPLQQPQPGQGPGGLMALMQFLGFNQQPQQVQKPGQPIGTAKARADFRKGFGL